MTATAQRLGEAVVRSLRQRGGFDAWWSGLSGTTRAEIAADAGMAAAEEMNRIRDEIGSAGDAAARFREEPL